MANLSVADAKRRIATRPGSRLVPVDPEAFRKVHDDHVEAFVARLAENPDERAVSIADRAVQMEPGEERDRLLDAARTRQEPVRVVHTRLYNAVGLAPSVEQLLDAGYWTVEDVEAAIEMGGSSDYPRHQVVESNLPGYDVAVITQNGAYYFETKED